MLLLCTLPTRLPRLSLKLVQVSLQLESLAKSPLPALLVSSHAPVVDVDPSLLSKELSNST